MSNITYSQPTPRPLDPQVLRILARTGIILVALGLLLLGVAVYPDLLNLDGTPGIGLAQLIFILLAVYIATAGGYLWAFASRLRGLPRRLREDIGLRLGATGLVICSVSALVDVLGLGTHNLPDVFPTFGEWQRFGMLVGSAVILLGILLYAQRVSPKTGFTQPMPSIHKEKIK